MGDRLRRHDLASVGLLTAAGLGLTIVLLNVLRPFGFWLSVVVAGVMVSALWIGLVFDAAVRFGLIPAAGWQHVTQGILTAFFVSWIALGLVLHLGVSGAPMGAAVAATLMLWRRSRPETWPEFQREA